MTTLLNPCCNNCSCTGTRSIFVGGSWTNIGGVAQSFVAKIKLTGTVDTAWSATLNGAVRCMVLYNGVLYIGGDFTTVNGSTRNRIAALSAYDGSLTSWDPNANGQVFDIAIENDIVYFGGGFTTVGGIARQSIAAVDTSGVLQAISATFSPAGPILCLAVQSAVAYFAGPSFTTVNGTGRNKFAALSLAGTLQSWNPNVGGFTGGDMLILNSIVYFVGAFSAVGVTTRAGAAAMDMVGAGTLQPWDPAPGPVPSCIATDGVDLYIGGTMAANRLVKVDVSGTTMTWTSGVGGTVNTVLADTSVVYYGGSFTTSGNSQPRNRAAASGAESAKLLAWNPNADNTVRALAFAA